MNKEGNSLPSEIGIKQELENPAFQFASGLSSSRLLKASPSLIVFHKFISTVISQWELEKIQVGVGTHMRIKS